MLELAGLSVKAGDFDLHTVDLRVGTGECHVIVGPTGSGKTLLLESILGLRRLGSGSVKLRGKEITRYSVEHRGIGYVPQDLALFPHLTVRQNIRYGLRMRGLAGPEGDRLIAELVATVGISGLMERRPRNLSGGERQRVALVRALASGNSMLLLDEPFSALNESLRKDLWLMIEDLRRRYGLTLLMITHDLEEAFFLGDTLSILIDGRLCQSGDKRSVYQRPATLEVARFFGIKNLYRGTLQEGDRTSAQVACGGLAQTLRVRVENLASDCRDGAQVIAGIRPTEVMVLREGIPHPPRENLLRGRVGTIHDKGAAYSLLFQPDATADRVEIELNGHAFRKLRLAEGRPGTVSLKEENLFVVRAC